jgi:hypothetical protein
MRWPTRVAARGRALNVLLPLGVKENLQLWQRTGDHRGRGLQRSGRCRNDDLRKRSVMWNVTPDELLKSKTASITDAYAYPHIWSPLTCAVFPIATSQYSERHRDMPGG